MIKIKNFQFFLCLYFFPITFFSQIISDRPDQTESSLVVGSGKFQIESGLIFENNSEQSERNLITLNNLIRYGIFKGYELRLNTNIINGSHNYTESKSYVLTDFEIGAKIQILDNYSKKTKIAFLNHYLFTLKNLYNNNSSGLISRILISHELNKNFQIAYNLGYNNYFNIHPNELIYTLALSKSFSTFSIFCEVFGVETNIISQINWDVGITYEFKKNIQIDLAKAKGFNNSLDYFTLGICLLF